MSYQRSSIRVFLIAFCCPRPFSRGHVQCTAECVAKYIERHSQVNEVLFSSLSVTWLLFRLRQSARWISPRRFTHSLLFHGRWVSAPCEAISKCIIKSNNKPTNHVNGDQERRIKKCSRSLSLFLFDIDWVIPKGRNGLLDWGLLPNEPWCKHTHAIISALNMEIAYLFMHCCHTTIKCVLLYLPQLEVLSPANWHRNWWILFANEEVEYSNEA